MSANLSTMSLPHALRYPWQGTNWVQRLLALTLFQFVPIIGQAILIGYGMAVARSVFAEEHDLPPLYPLQAAGDGVRLLLAGLLYVVPILLFMPTLLTIGFTRSDETGNSGNFSFVFITLIVAMVIIPLLRRLPLKYQALKSVIVSGISIVPLFMFITIIANLISNPAMLEVGDAPLNTTGVVLLIILGLLILIILVGLHINGLRYAIEGQGLLDPMGSIRLLLVNRIATGKLIINLGVLVIVGGILTLLGLPFMLPAAFTLVVTTLAIWYILARYGQGINMQPTFDVSSPV